MKNSTPTVLPWHKEAEADYFKQYAFAFARNQPTPSVAEVIASHDPHAAQHANAEDAARLFHETYERLAPTFGYATRADTKVFDPTTPNGKLMTAVCGEVLSRVHAAQHLRQKPHSMACNFPEGCTCGASEWNGMIAQHQETVRLLEKAVAQIEAVVSAAEWETLTARKLLMATQAAEAIRAHLAAIKQQ